MDYFVRAILMNAVLATVLAVGVAVVCRFVRQPTVVRALWLLVLLRLAVPPLIGLPVVFPGLTLDPRPSTVADTLPAVPNTTATASQAAPVANQPIKVTGNPQIAVHRSGSRASTCLVPRASWKWPNSRRLVLAFWALGSAIWCTVTLLRVARFSRWLRQAKPAPPRLATRARAVARQLGLRSIPRVLVVAGRISPSLWGWGGRTCILLPHELLTTLDGDQHDMLLAHELAHYRRRDHWCRWFEVLLLAAYWWHPVAWWARNRLVRAEEESCDAWVLWAYPRKIRKYAETLLATVDFLSPSPSVVAPAATGVSVFPLLKRRLEMILQDRPRHRMTTLTKACLACLALSALSLSPTLLADKTTPEAAEEQVAAEAKQNAEELAPPEWKFDRELAAGLNAALRDLREKESELLHSRLRLLGVVAQLEGHRDRSVELSHQMVAQRRKSDIREVTMMTNFQRVLAAQDEVNGRRAVWDAGVDKQLDGDTTNLYLNALQRLAEAQNEYFISLSETIDVSELGEAAERQKQQWLAHKRLETAIAGRDATLRTWQAVRARREESAKNATIQAESQARTQYFAFQAIVDLAQKEYLKGI